MTGTDYRHRCTTAECPYLGQLTDNLSCGCHRKEAEIMKAELTRLMAPRPIEEYDEDMGDVLWWKFPIVEPPYVGSPNGLGFEVIIQPSITLHIATGETEEKDDPSSDDLTSKPHKFFVGGFPGYHTHFTLLPIPKEPK